MQPRRQEGLRPVRVRRAPPLPTPRRSPSVAEVKISDFGLSALYGSAHSAPLLHTTCGTPNYVAPEVIADQVRACTQSYYIGAMAATRG